jgi:hypothetical protein
LKFSGYGRYGRAVAARAAAAADAGWSLPPSAARDGWIEFRWVGEARVLPNEVPSHEDLDRIAGYLAFIARTRAVSETTDCDEFLHMAVINAREVAGDAAARLVESVRPTEPGTPVLVDNRMRRHEWIRVDGRLQKLDGLDHGDDHFFPGPCDIAWDVAGVIEEWALDTQIAAVVVDRVVALTGDQSLPLRLPFYHAAYLAFRGAYTSFCRAQLTGTEGERFGREHDRYRSRLGALVACAS